ncbi:MAG: hypothetical protein J0I84_22090 [Terrimonas sp.]|nr:hypothetical protein [Terrimonas sp.]OJY99603.1 MAG: NTPase KAP [Sphingobacteriales bacterium 40-81]
MILSDNETRVDLLNSEAIAKTIVNLITERPDHPVTIGVHGDWGAGKSSVLEMIEAGLADQQDVIVIKFNGWRFQGFEDAKISLIEGIVTELVEKRSLFTKAKDEVVDIYKRIDWLKLAKKAGGLAWTAFTGIPSAEIVQTVIEGLENIAKAPTKLATKENIEGLITGAKSILKPKDDSKNIPTEIGEFRKSFDILLKKAGIKQLIVLVDDLDRCLPDTAIETLEAIRLFVFTTKTAFVVAADEGMIEYAVRRHFPEFSETIGAQTYSRNYLEKLIQVPFRIPVLGETETRIYVTLLLVGSELGDGDADFEKLIKAARERLKKPWEGTPLDATAIKAALGDKATKVQNALLISDQIGPILANGTKGNPRQIKRFLNTLILRQRTAEARGFGQLISIPVLAKLMIAERFLPRLFEQIATLSASSADGKSIEIAEFEKRVKEDGQAIAKKATKSVSGKEAKEKEPEPQKPAVESAYINEWKSSKEIEDWSKINPPLSDVDLRPYIFVSKDKKDYFGISSSLGHLTNLAEKLFGSKLAVAALETDLKKLTSQEARQIFDAIRSRLISSSSFETEPGGASGLAYLVKLHPLLQPDLLDFLEGLPKDKLGAWAVKGWEASIIDTIQKERFSKLISFWSTSSNSILKAAASGVQKMGGAR